MRQFCPSFSEAFPAVWLSVCLRWRQQRGHAKESLLVNVNCQRIEASSSIALPWSSGQWNPSEEHQRDSKRKRERTQWHWISGGSHGQKSERENVSESDFPSPVTRSSDSLVAGSLSSRLWLPECIRGPVCNLTSQYWNSNASSHSINCCLVIGFQTCGTGSQDVLASLIMLCHGSWRESCNDV